MFFNDEHLASNLAASTFHDFADVLDQQSLYSRVKLRNLQIAFYLNKLTNFQLEIVKNTFNKQDTLETCRFFLLRSIACCHVTFPALSHHTDRRHTRSAQVVQFVKNFSSWKKRFLCWGWLSNWFDWFGIQKICRIKIGIY